MSRDSTARVAQLQTAAEVSLRVAAKECLRESGWNVERARKRLKVRIIEDETLMAEAIDSAMMHELSAVSSQQKTSLCRPVPAGSDNITALKRSMGKSYLESWLVMGKKLGDASPDDIRVSMQRRSSVSDTLQRYNRFEGAILKALKTNTKRVRDVLNDDDLRLIASKHLA